MFSDHLALRRHKKIAPYLQGDILDLGCGDARTLEWYGTRVEDYWGVERQPQRVEILRRRFPSATFICRDLDREKLNIHRMFDCVLMLAIIEHLFNQRFVIEQVARLLKPDGVSLVTTPTPFGNDVVHRVGASLGLFAKSAVEDHIVIYNRQRFSILAGEVGLSLNHHEYFELFCNQFAVLKRSQRESMSAVLDSRREASDVE